ncbi:MAG TPA: hypothetical protein ENN20_05060 [Candidatus Marinimicrobia bacterium]|nr:hypothetical protein [Candidatus Neomarinimicrobiota bacterium]
MDRFKQSWQYVLILLIFGYNVSRADVNLWVMSFDNLYSDSEIQWLKEGFVDFILDHYANNPNIKAYKSEQLDETLSKIKKDTKYQQAQNLLLTGAYERRQGEFRINLQLTDLNTWKTKAETKVKEKSADLERLILSVNNALDKLIDPQIKVGSAERSQESASPVRAPGIPPVPEPKSGREITVATRNISKALERLLAEYSDHPRQEYKSPKPLQMSRFHEDAFTGRVKDFIHETHSFEEVVDHVLGDPYIINIGEPSIQRLPTNSSSVSLSFRIDYQIKLKILQEMVETLQIKAKKEGRTFVEYSFSGNNYVFTTDFIRKVAQGEYRYFPVISLVDENGNVLTRIIDAPGRLDQIKHFNPMFNIVAGPWTMTIYLVKGIQEIDYNLVLPINTVAKISQVRIDMLPEEEIVHLKSQ